jgi:hypothetical protein
MTYSKNVMIECNDWKKFNDSRLFLNSSRQYFPSRTRRASGCSFSWQSNMAKSWQLLMWSMVLPSECSRSCECPRQCNVLLRYLILCFQICWFVFCLISKVGMEDGKNMKLTKTFCPGGLMCGLPTVWRGMLAPPQLHGPDWFSWWDLTQTSPT